MIIRGRAKLFLTGLGSLMLLLSLSSVSASSANISHSYHPSGNLVNGDIVSLDPSRSDYVQPANVNNGARLLGVVVVASDSLVAANDGSGTAQVAISGTANALASTLNGNISVGDQVAVSPFNGVGMKALPGSRVIGLAQAGLSASSRGATQQQVTDKSGHKHQITVGYVPLEIVITVNSVTKSDSQLNSLQTAAANLTGRTIPTIRIVISLVVAIVALATLLMLIYAAIYGGIISVGRNPLAKHAVYRSLTGVATMILFVAAVAATVIYFLLR